MTTAERRENYIRWTEITYWLLSAFLVGYTYYSLTDAGRPAVALYVLAIGVGLTTSLVFRLMPDELTVGRFRYQSEDKFLFSGLLVLGLLTVYVFLAYGAAADLEFLYFVPIVLSALLLNEKIILAETSLALLAVTFLQEAYGARGLATGPFAVRAAVLVIAGLISFKLTVELRQRADQSSGLLSELSRRLDQIQAVSVIVKQVEFFAHLDTLLQRIVEALGSVFAAERIGLFLLDGPDKNLKPVAFYCADCVDAQRGLDAVEGLGMFREIADDGQGRLVSGLELAESGFRAFEVKEMMIVPLRVRDRAIGTVFVANKLHGRFAQVDLDFLGLLASYVASLVDSAQSFQAVSAEREKAERMLKLMVGREIRMRELKNRLDQRPPENPSV